MRITGGEWRSRALEAPQGRDTTRPTTDRVREAMCSMLYSACGLTFETTQALDAFAGSGALGLELLSRGAAYVTFCDIDAKAAALVERNARSLGAAHSAYKVQKCDVWRSALAPSFPGAPFSVVLLDPPYAIPALQVASLVEALDAAGHLTQHALILYERSNSAPSLELAGFSPLKSKRYGQTAVDLLRKD